MPELLNYLYRFLPIQHIVLQYIKPVSSVHSLHIVITVEFYAIHKLFDIDFISYLYDIVVFYVSVCNIYTHITTMIQEQINSFIIQF